MLKDYLLGRLPSHFSVNQIVRAYIISESFVWSAWNLVIPILAIFVVDNIKGGSIQTAASAYSIYLLTRVVFELICGKILVKTNDSKKYTIALMGIVILGFSYLFFSISQSVSTLLIGYMVAGLGLGLSAPAKNALFSIHIEKNKEATDWSIADAVTFGCMALASALGGFFVSVYGFQVLFAIAAAVNFLGAIPFILFIYKKDWL
jgi:MFS family permease